MKLADTFEQNLRNEGSIRRKKALVTEAGIGIPGKEIKAKLIRLDRLESVSGKELIIRKACDCHLSKFSNIVTA